MIKIKSKFTYEKGCILISVPCDEKVYQQAIVAPRLHADEKINEKLYTRVMDAISDLQYAVMAQANAVKPLTKDMIKNALDEAFEAIRERHQNLFILPSVSPTKYSIDRVIFKDPATIVFWKDGTKTVVKAKNEPYDKEKGLAMAFMKKHLGNKGRYFDTVKKYTKEKSK